MSYRVQTVKKGKKDQNDGKGQKAKFRTSDLMDSNESI